ncbi:LPXTG cell wall anchor domain-containing protein [Enterococcus alishanensis]
MLTSGKPNYAQETRSSDETHGVATFYGEYSYPSSSTDQSTNQNQINKSLDDHQLAYVSNNGQTPSYSANGAAIIPKTGDNNFFMLQLIGMVFLLFSLSLFIYKREKGENI